MGRLPLALSHSDCEIEFVHGLAINFLVSPESAAHGGGGGAATVYGSPGCRPEDFGSILFIYLFFVSQRTNQGWEFPVHTAGKILNYSDALCKGKSGDDIWETWMSP